MSTYGMLIGVAVLLLGTTGVAASEMDSLYGKYGIAGVCVMLSVLLITKTIPYIVDKHNESWREMSGKMDAVKDAIDRGNERLIEALTDRGGKQ